jgi:hypothetical protein
MVLPQPTEFPDWATQDQTDPVSHINNVVTPPLEMQQSGWHRQEYPPRQWFNWLARFTGKWIRYLNQQAGSAATDITALQASIAAFKIHQTVVIQGTYGVATSVGICDVNVASIVKLTIIDTTGGFADDWLEGNFTPRNAAPDRVINVTSSNSITVSDVDHTTGKITASSATLGATTYQLVATQYILGV